MNKSSETSRVIAAAPPKTWKTVLLRWESLLLLIFIAVNVTNGFLSPHYFSVSGLFGATVSFLDKGFLALGMVYILILGGIDISVGSATALSAVIMAVSYNKLGFPMALALLAGILVGTLCGLINGLILTRFTELAPMIVTLGTMILYRGLAIAILGDKASGGFTSITWFTALGWGGVGPVPFMFIVFALCATAMAVVLHRTVFGRWLYAIGRNRVAARYAGIRTERVRLLAYTLMGFYAGLTSVFMLARMGSTRPNIATGYELDAIAMCVLGGIMTDGGKGNYGGAIIAIFTLGFLKYGLGLINVQSQLMTVIVGALLIVSVMIPNLKPRRKGKKARSAAASDSHKFAA